MQSALALPVLSPPDFLSAIWKMFHSVRELIARINSEKSETKRRVDQITQLLDNIKPLVENHLAIERVISQKHVDALITQIQFLMDYMLRDIQSMLTVISRNEKKLPGKLYKRLKSYLAVLREMTSGIGKKFMERHEAYPSTAMPLYKIDRYILLTPLRVFMEDDDSGKYVSCLELPQIYGFGETEAEAMAMLEREILSLQEDVKASDSISEEYLIASQLIDAALIHNG